MKRSTECDRFEELLPLYIDGDISDIETAEVREHLSGCELCSGALETFRSLEASLSEMPGILPDPRSVSARVTESLGLKRRRKLAPVFSRMSLVWSFAVTTAALILLLGRFDLVSAIMSGQASFVDSAGKTMEYWIAASSGTIAGLLNQVETVLANDPWILVAGMTGFGMVVFTAGIATALKTMR